MAAEVVHDGVVEIAAGILHRSAEREQFVGGQADQRAAEVRGQGDVLPAVNEELQHVAHVEDFDRVEERFAGAGEAANAAGAEDARDVGGVLAGGTQQDDDVGEAQRAQGEFLVGATDGDLDAGGQQAVNLRGRELGLALDRLDGALIVGALGGFRGTPAGLLDDVNFDSRAGGESRIGDLVAAGAEAFGGVERRAAQGAVEEQGEQTV